MMTKKIFKTLLLAAAALLFVWFFLLKIVSRIAARMGWSAPCPASVSWIVDNPLRRRVMRPVLSWVDIQPGERVLELGPGPGAFTVAAARQTGPQGQLSAVDIQPRMIEQVQHRVRAAGLTNVETHVADACQLPFSDHGIDRAFLISVLPEIPDPARVLAELHRVLRPEGTLSITAEFADPDYLFANETVRLCEQAGFTLAARHGNWWRYTLNFKPAQGRAINSSYYVARQKQMVREFDRVVRRIRPLIMQRYDSAFSEQLEADAHTEFIGLIPQLPYIGGRANPLTWNLVGTAWLLALYRAMQRQGKGVAEVGPLFSDIYSLWLDAYPDWLLKLRGRYQFTLPARLSRDSHARLSQERRYPGDWVYSTVPKNGHDFGVDYTECGIMKFCQAQDAGELMPYLCSTDFIMSERMRLGLERRSTLAEGGARCDFRFTRPRDR